MVNLRSAKTARWRRENLGKYRQYNQDQLLGRARKRAAVKWEVLAFYGLDGQAVCVNCGFANPDALTFDHVNDNGRAERADKWRSGYSLAAHLKKSGYPEGYQTLCANCNQLKEVNRRRAMSPEEKKVYGRR
jgi:hypothetical protein